MKGLEKNLIAKFNRFFYFIFWSYYFSAGYFFCKNKYNSFSNEYLENPFYIS